MQKSLPCLVIVFLCLGIASTSALADDQPQWGERHTRNMVSAETGLPDSFEPGRPDRRTGKVDLSTTKNVRWSMPAGQVVYGAPVIAEGKVLVGTNNAERLDPRMEGDRGVLICYDEETGDYLWQLNMPKMCYYRNDDAMFNEYRFADWARVGICSPPSCEDGVAYVVTNNCEVMCLDLDGMSDGNDGPYKDEGQHMAGIGQTPLPVTEKDADILWCFDMMTECDVKPHNASNSSVLVDGDVLYLCTSNGVDAGHTYVYKPHAPTLIALHKQTGELLAVDDFGIGKDIVHGQWSSPALGEVNGKRLVFQGAGNGYMYACEAIDPQTTPDGTVRKLKNVWKFNGHPLAQTQEHVPLEHVHDTHSYEVVANPVVYDDKLYVVFTQELFHNIPDGWLCCIDPSMEGDTTRNGGLLWSYEGITSCSSTPAIADGLVYVADGTGWLHCVDAKTGELQWKYELGGKLWASPLVADGKVYIGTGRRSFHILKHGRELEELAEIQMPDHILCSATAANGMLYVPTMSQVYAVEKE